MTFLKGDDALKWHAPMTQAYYEAAKSQDPSTQNGVVILDRYHNYVSRAHNGLTKGVVSTPEIWERPMKYDWVEHAERNAIYKLNHWNAPPYTMVAEWAACIDCARAIVQSGITTLVRHREAQLRTPDNWRENIKTADKILEAGDVEVIDVSMKVFPELRHTEQVWVP